MPKRKTFTSRPQRTHTVQRNMHYQHNHYQEEGDEESLRQPQHDVKLIPSSSSSSSSSLASTHPPAAFLPTTLPMPLAFMVYTLRTYLKTAPEWGVLYFDAKVPSSSLGVTDDLCLRRFGMHEQVTNTYIPNWAHNIKDLMMNSYHDRKELCLSIVRSSVLLMERSKPFPFSGLGILLSKNYSKENCAHPTAAALWENDFLLWDLFRTSVDLSLMNVFCCNVIVEYHKWWNSDGDGIVTHTVRAYDATERRFTSMDHPLLCTGNVMKGNCIQYERFDTRECYGTKIVALQSMLILAPKPQAQSPPILHFHPPNVRRTVTRGLQFGKKHT